VASMNLAALPLEGRRGRGEGEGEGEGSDGRGGLCLAEYCPSAWLRSSSWADRYIGNYDGNKWLYNFFARSLSQKRSRMRASVSLSVTHTCVCVPLSRRLNLSSFSSGCVVFFFRSVSLHKHTHTNTNTHTHTCMFFNIFSHKIFLARSFAFSSLFPIGFISYSYCIELMHFPVPSSFNFFLCSTTPSLATLAFRSHSCPLFFVGSLLFPFSPVSPILLFPDLPGPLLVLILVIAAASLFLCKHPKP